MFREERLARTMSMAQNKGLLNNPGENNCFLNSAVQVFWHLDVFRRSFREFKGHFCKGKSCIFCALENIFKEFQYSSNDALPPDTLRIAMANTFKDQRKFQMGDMDDAAECFENILSHMHFHLVVSEHDDSCNAQHCITHQKFAMQLIEQTICPCGERSEPLPFFQTVHYVSASALCAQARRFEKQARQEYNSTKHFDTLLRLTGEDTKRCTSRDCGQNIQVQRWLLNCPDIVSIGLSWDSESPDAEHIAEVLQCIGTRLSLLHFFHQVYEKNAQRTTLNLVGVVTYYGKHYSTFFFHSKLKTWIYFDDARVIEIGPDWSVIREKCRRCHYQPLLLLYANPNGTPINASTAPKEKVFIKPSTFARKTDMSPMSRRISAEVSRLEFEKRRKRRSSSPESGLVETDSESNISTLKSEKQNSLSTMEGSNDTLKAKDNVTTNDDDDTLKARGHSSRKDMISSSKSRRSKSCDWLDEGAKSRSPRGRTASTGSDVTDTLKRKHHKNGKPKKTGLRRIGSAIFQAMKPGLAISNIKTSKKKIKSGRPSIECNGDRASTELSPSSETKQAGVRMHEQAKLEDYLRSPSHDSGIGSATGSVSSSDTNHGGSDDDLVDYSHTHIALRNGFRNTKTKKGPPHERCAILLQEAEALALKSQNSENSNDYLTAIRFCSDAAARFRQAAEVSGIKSNNGRYALMKVEELNLKLEELRGKFEAQSHLKMSRAASSQDEFLRQQRRRDEMILKQQQQNHAQYGTLPRNHLPTYKQLYPPSCSVSTKLDDTSSTKASYQSIATLPVKPKRNSSSHYTSKARDRTSESVCSQKIKPDSMCYNPNHYDDITSRMQALNLDHRDSADRLSVYDNVIVDQPKRSPERRVSSTKIYLQPQRNDMRLSKGYDPSRYTSQEQDLPRQPRVYYQGTSDISGREPRSKSYDVITSSRVLPYNGFAPSHRSPPSYEAVQQAKGMLHNSCTRPWYQDNASVYSEPILDSATSPTNLRAISPRYITDKLLCERCCQVPISRQQRICAGCEQENYRRHRLTDHTDMLY